MRGQPSALLTTKGFTLVELVIALVLVGILSALGVGLLVSPGAYSASAARDQFLSSALLAQKQALADTSTTYALSIRQYEDQWCFHVAASSDASCNAGQEGARLAAREGATLQNNPGTLYFRSGQRVDAGGSPLPVGNSVNLTFTGANGGNSHSVCVSSSGLAYAGSCVDGDA